MTQPVIDTLKLADSLKDSGFPDRQAEGLARALGRALTEHVVTKADLDAAIQLVRADIVALDNRGSAVETKLNAVEIRVDAIETKVNAIETKVNAVETKVNAVETKVNAVETKVNAVETKVDAVETKVDAVNTKVDAVDAKFEAMFKTLGTQIRFIFAMLALLLALGMVETVVPLLS